MHALLSRVTFQSDRNQSKIFQGGGGIVNQLKKSYSLSDLSDPYHDNGADEADIVISDPRLLRRRRSPTYFHETEARSDRIQHVQSVEDISSGYSSGEGLYVAGQPPKLQAREGLVRTGSLTRARTTRVTRSTGVVKKPSVSEDAPRATLPRTKKASKKKTL